ncbi:putative carbohydrate esterase [Cocos nucifera]|uniref:Putative carbohydrate esterase n=1 Tax=Cocos nucifera TaxID=13894 RepID=A0A8K0IL77_COCNU|nr:putative carbohydrate esterase [Cocos nucifera]
MFPLLSLLLQLLASVPASHLFDCSVGAGAGAGPNQSGTAAETRKLMFILAGQSNMAGRGGVSGDQWNHVVPPECRPTPSILRLNAGLQWEEAWEPLHADIDVLKTCGVGPGMPFAHEILNSGAAPAVVGLVPCAMGGTKITQWEKGTQLYEEMVRRARTACGGGGRVGAVLWYQGESDTVSLADAVAYKGRMEKLIRDLRSDLGLPGLLVIQVALASGEGNFTDIVRQAQKGISLPNVACVDAKGLALQSDHLHLTTQAQVQLGKMLATSYLNHSKIK